MAQAPEHPLLSLPDDQIIQKLREMSLDEILKYSLISEECKERVKSIQIKGTSIYVFIDEGIKFFITTGSIKLRLDYYTRPEDMFWGWGAYGRKKKLLTPRTVEVNVFDNDDQVSGPVFLHSEFALKDWLKHLLDIFNYNGIDSMRFFEGSSNFDIDDIREVFGNKSKFYIEFLNSDAYKQLILEKFFPIEKISIMTSTFQDSKLPANILIQNFEYLRIRGLFHEKVLKLDELLMINSKVIEINIIQVLSKDFNKFIKLWQQGSNPHMERLSISHPSIEEDNVDWTIMKGIKHDVVPANRIRKFKSAESKNPRLVHGGMDIYRNDGVKATIQIETKAFWNVWYMYVWFDHCVVE
ncbi:unnamed protein product [Caenorhabditis brenneri]